MDTCVTANSTLTGNAHPATSFAAAAKVLGRTGTARHRVLLALAASGRTDEELQCHLGMSPNTERPRRVELVRHGYVADSGLRRASASGTRSIVWAPTDAGRAALRAVGVAP